MYATAAEAQGDFAQVHMLVLSCVSCQWVDPEGGRVMDPLEYLKLIYVFLEILLGTPLKSNSTILLLERVQ